MLINDLTFLMRNVTILLETEMTLFSWFVSL